MRICELVFPGLLLALLLAMPVTAATRTSRVLDDFEDLSLWTAQHTDDVAAKLSSAQGTVGRALRLDFDFTDPAGHPINGYATARRELPLDLPDNYELSFWIRGAAGVNTLQFKLVDASGENVWWLNRPDFTFPREWQQIRIKKREVEFAWGPAADRQLRHSASIEFVVSSGRDGGKGFVELDDLAIRELPPQDDSPLQPLRVSANSALPGFPASAAIDGKRETAWRSDPRRHGEQHLDLDLGKVREFSGIVLHWHRGERATAWDVQQSTDAKRWHSCGGALVRHGDDSAQMLCDSQARYLRLRFQHGEAAGVGLDEIEIKDPAWAASANAFFQNVARTVPRGTYPRGFSEQPYWTIVGVDGGAAPALISEDGAIEPRKGGWSIEPFLLVDGRRYTWADVRSTQALLDGYLPMPSVEWSGVPVQLRIETFARGTLESAQLVVRYRLKNASAAVLDASLQLALRPFQVNPPAQFLNAAGGVASIDNLRWNGTMLQVHDSIVRPLQAPDEFALLDDDGNLSAAGLSTTADGARGAYDELGRLSGALVYKFHLPVGAEREVDIVTPIAGAAAATDVATTEAAAWVAREQDAAANAWRERLDRVTLSVPPQAQRLADALRTAHAHMLLSRDGPALRPGTRSYARSWIRDGAMIADALLRLGDTGAVREYVDWYAPHQFANGKVPCCVDHRGSDPVPENDSHGELIHAIAQLYRYGGDRDTLEKNWPHVAAAIGYMDALRAAETTAVDSAAANPAFKGLLPASISHEGYSAKPMHSYWDDFWGLTGYNDAVEIAQVLGRADAAARIASARDAFARDLQASLAIAAVQHGIDYLPGCAELGDFDATSTTIMLAPAGAQAQLPQDLLHNTFERYWRDFAARADGRRPWNDYTPYEWRTVGSFVRLGQRERALAAIDFFFRSGARPPGWNQWAEVVRRDARQAGFIGDMPHAWVASDFARSVLDLFAYERYEDRALVLAAGVPLDWLDGNGIAIAHLRTPYGELSYTLKRNGRRTLLHVAAGAKPPGGFVFAGPAVTSAVRSVRAGGQPLVYKGGELHIAGAPVEIVIDD